MTYAENINQFLALHLAHCNGRYCNADHGYTFEAWFWWLFSIVFTPDLLSWLTGVRGQHCRVQCWKKLDLHLGIRRDDKANIWKGETADKGREFPYRHREYLQIPCGKHFLFIEQLTPGCHARLRSLGWCVNDLEADQFPLRKHVAMKTLWRASKTVCSTMARTFCLQRPWQTS